MKKIRLTCGKSTLVDDSDYENLSKHKWYFNKLGYAERRIKKTEGGLIMRMHRVIMDAPTGVLVDHVNMNGLDNRRKNLRLCTKAENMRNRRKTVLNKSGYKGVYWDSYSKKWKAQLRINGFNQSLGRFTKLKEAAAAYNRGALLYFGEFANLNKI